MPLVSVIVPNFNYARYLPHRLGSIERQTFRDFEVILLDDASSDDSVRVLEQYAEKNGWQLVCNEQNSGGVFKQWNKGAKLASGKYIWIAEADDYADERFLEVLVGRLEQNPHCGVAYCNSLKIDEEDRVLEMVAPTLFDVDPTRWRRDFINNGRDECCRYLLRENTLPNASAVVFRRDLFQAVGGADESLRICSDLKLWASMLSRSDIVFAAEPLNFYRTHGTSVRAKVRMWAGIHECLMVMRYIADIADAPKQAMQDLHARLALSLLYAYLFQQKPNQQELARTRELLADLNFGFSPRAARKFIKVVAQAALQHVPGAALHERNRLFAQT